MPERSLVLDDVARALAEDVGPGDPSAGLIDASVRARATVTTREDAVLCGMAWFTAAFHALDRAINITWHRRDAERLSAGDTLCTLEGSARAMLTGERTALNFLQTLSGTATRVAAFCDRVAGLPVTLLDTRKTLPGLRAAQKYAVLCGGGRNHRMGLHDAILIKENHLAASGSLTAAIQTARELHPGLLIQAEIERLDQLEEAIAAGLDLILLDNFTVPELREAARRCSGQIPLEASGGITLETVRAVAETGVDRIAIGALTKDLHAIDLSMRFQLTNQDLPADESGEG